MVGRSWKRQQTQEYSSLPIFQFGLWLWSPNPRLKLGLGIIKCFRQVKTTFSMSSFSPYSLWTAWKIYTVLSEVCSLPKSYLFVNFSSHWLTFSSAPSRVWIRTAQAKRFGIDGSSFAETWVWRSPCNCTAIFERNGDGEGWWQEGKTPYPPQILYLRAAAWRKSWRLHPTHEVIPTKRRYLISMYCSEISRHSVTRILLLDDAKWIRRKGLIWISSHYPQRNVAWLQLLWMERIDPETKPHMQQLWDSNISQTQHRSSQIQMYNEGMETRRPEALSFRRRIKYRHAAQVQYRSHDCGSQENIYFQGSLRCRIRNLSQIRNWKTRWKRTDSLSDDIRWQIRIQPPISNQFSPVPCSPPCPPFP